MLFPVWFPHTTLCHKVTNPLLKSTASRIQFEIHTSLDLQCNSVVAPFFVARLAKHEQCFFAHRLFFAVAHMGENWSVGQKQLLCFVRVILKRSRILFMDEATTSVDSQTDAAIQRIIREEFTECTVISIAHRIPTVMDSDRVLVLDAGRPLH